MSFIYYTVYLTGCGSDHLEMTLGTTLNIRLVWVCMERVKGILNIFDWKVPYGNEWR